MAQRRRSKPKALPVPRAEHDRVKAALEERVYQAEQKAEDYREKLLEHGIEA